MTGLRRSSQFKLTEFLKWVFHIFIGIFQNTIGSLVFFHSLQRCESSKKLIFFSAPGFGLTVGGSTSLGAVTQSSALGGSLFGSTATGTGNLFFLLLAWL
jgi:hypothetical protein